MCEQLRNRRVTRCRCVQQDRESCVRHRSHLLREYVLAPTGEWAISRESAYHGRPRTSGGRLCLGDSQRILRVRSLGQNCLAYQKAHGHPGRHVRRNRPSHQNHLLRQATNTFGVRSRWAGVFFEVARNRIPSDSTTFGGGRSDTSDLQSA